MTGLQRDAREATRCNVDRVRLRIDSSRAPRRTYTADKRLLHVDYCACMGFGDVVQEYDDGAEFRPASEVTDPAAVSSFKGLVFTDEHPDDGVDASMATTVTRGHILETWAEGPDMWGWIRVIDERTIGRIDAGKDKLSCGYDLRLDATPGEFNGIPYKRIQRGIRGNHVALTWSPRGERGTDNPRFRFDSKGAPVRVQKDSSAMKLVKINIPGVGEVEVPEAVAALITSLQSKVAELGGTPDAAPPGAPPAAPVDDSEKPPVVAPTVPVAPRSDAKAPITRAEIDVLLAEQNSRVDARFLAAQKQHRQDALEYGRFQEDAAAVLRLDGKSYTFTGDLAVDRLGVAEQLLGDKDPDIVAAKARLGSRNDSQVAEARAGSAGLYKAATIAARARHDKTDVQLAGLVPRHDSADASVDAVLAASQHGFRPAATP